MIKNHTTGISALQCTFGVEAPYLSQHCGQTGADDRSSRSVDNEALTYFDVYYEQAGAENRPIGNADNTTSAANVLRHPEGPTAFVDEPEVVPTELGRSLALEVDAVDADPTTQEADKDTRNWPASDANKHCVLKVLHAFARHCGGPGNRRWWCCGIALGRKEISLATPASQDRGSCRSVMAMSPNGKTVLEELRCSFDTGADLSIIRATCATRLGWTLNTSFDPDRYGVQTVQGMPIVPIGEFTLTVRPEGMRPVFGSTFLVVADRDCNKVECVLSEKFVQRSHLHHKVPICATRIVLAFLTMLRPVSLEAGR